MTFPWRFTLSVLVAILALLCGTPAAHAAAEVHKFNIVLTAIPTAVEGGDFNRQIDLVNRTALQPLGLETLEEISTGWQFGVEMRYFIRPNVAVAAGVSQLRAQTEREYLPGLTQDIVLTADILSVPIHLGADYYFTPYNQGDFRAQGYFGGGILSLTSTRARLRLTALGIEPSDPSFTNVTAGDGPGFYVETGVHMFFALRYSVMLGAIYRSAKVENTGLTYTAADGVPQYLGTFSNSVDVSGVGARASVAIGF